MKEINHTGYKQLQNPESYDPSRPHRQTLHRYKCSCGWTSTFSRSNHPWDAFKAHLREVMAK